MQILQYIALTIGVVGAGVIIWGVMMAVIEFVRLEHKRFRGEYLPVQRTTQKPSRFLPSPGDRIFDRGRHHP